MTTTATFTHCVEYPQSLLEGDDEKDLVLTFTRTMVRLHAIQVLARLYPCVSATDDVQVTTTIKRQVDPFNRTTLVGIASAPCSAPDTCPTTRKARP